MTIGIAVTGRNAGLAAFRALAAVEKVARGAIGGFVSFVAITADGTLARAETQRGGTTTLFTSGEATGVEPPAPVAGARFAALMSSGPDRPAPLAQFTPGDAAVGLVTGHRLPNVPGEGATLPLNTATLERMRAGADPRAAIEAELALHPEADAGLIALDLQGRLHLANSRFVERRGDLGAVCLDDPARHHAVAVLHNAIEPRQGIATLAAATALDSMAPPDRADFHIRLEAGLVLERGVADVLDVDATGRVVRITVSRRHLLDGRRDGSVLGFATPVRRDGKLLGHTVGDPYCVIEAGRLVSMSGQPSVTLGVHHDD
ncbi:MAG: hypothetical protein R3D28_24615 [Geminicoccaceae bacterium]